MAANKRANDCAFPTVAGDFGLTLREHFAGLAMQGILANDESAVNAQEMGRQQFIRFVAEDAVAHADALLAELAKEFAHV